MKPDVHILGTLKSIENFPYGNRGMFGVRAKILVTDRRTGQGGVGHYDHEMEFEVAGFGQAGDQLRNYPIGTYMSFWCELEAKEGRQQFDENGQPKPARWFLDLKYKGPSPNQSAGAPPLPQPPQQYASPQAPQQQQHAQPQGPHSGSPGGPVPGHVPPQAPQAVPQAPHPGPAQAPQAPPQQAQSGQAPPPVQNPYDPNDPGYTGVRPQFDPQGNPQPGMIDETPF